MISRPKPTYIVYLLFFINYTIAAQKSNIPYQLNDYTNGVNSTYNNNKDHTDSHRTVIWDLTEDNGIFNNNLTLIGQDDALNFNKKQAKSNGVENDITIAIIDLENDNNVNSNIFFADRTFLAWGNNNGGTTPAPDILKNFGSSTAVESITRATPISRIWKMVVTDSIPSVKLSIPKSMVSLTNTGHENYIMIIADDPLFTKNVTSATMEDLGTNLEVDFHFENTKYVTFGSTTDTKIGPRSAYFDNYLNKDSYLDAGNSNDLANKNFTISAWVKRDIGQSNFDILSKRNFNTNEAIAPIDNYTHGYALTINDSSKFCIEWKDPDDTFNNIIETKRAIPQNEWHHIAVTFNRSTNMTKLYVDGNEEANSNTLNPINVHSASHFLIGASHYIKRQRKARGSIDEVRVWDVTLSENQLRYLMNQEIENNSSFVDGKILPNNTSKNETITIPWSSLKAYYTMNTLVFGSVKDESNNRNDASMINYSSLDKQSAPLPYKTSGNDTDWDSPNSWINGNVQYIPGANSSLSKTESTIDYNIVQIDHDINLNNNDIEIIPASKKENRTLLGVIVNSGATLKLIGDNASNTGSGLTISHYLKLDGTIDLEGESQLIQTEHSDLDVSSKGNIERDQQGAKNLYTYNYWSSPVGIVNGSSNNNSYTLRSNIMKNGTISNSPKNINFMISGYNGSVNGTDISIADYWIWKYNNKTNSNYSSWQHVRSTGSLVPGEGFSMKGVDNSEPSLNTIQNYVFDGKPNNGTITLELSPGNDYLIGNPYASAIDADEFILDNIEDGIGRASNNVIEGTLYFWDHYASNSHMLGHYQGGYATYTLLTSLPPISNDANIEIETVENTKTPKRYIPVAQGFFVTAKDGGTITFRNSQRIFKPETDTNSSFVKSPNVKNSNSNTNSKRIIKFKFDSPSGYHRVIALGTMPDATTYYDKGYDAPLIEDNLEDIYWKFDDNNYVIQAINSFGEDKNLPLSIKINTSGVIKFQIQNLDNIEDNLNILLYDNLSNTYHNLRQGEYQIHLDSGEYNDRFEIAFLNSETLSNKEVINDNDIAIFFSNDKKNIIIQNPKFKNIQSIQIQNIVGQSIFQSYENISESDIEFKVNGIKSGTYIVKLKTNDNNSIIKKILAKI